MFSKVFCVVLKFLVVCNKPVKCLMLKCMRFRCKELEEKTKELHGKRGMSLWSTQQWNVLITPTNWQAQDAHTHMCIYTHKHTSPAHTFTTLTFAVGLVN